MDNKTLKSLYLTRHEIALCLLHQGYLDEFIISYRGEFEEFIDALAFIEALQFAEELLCEGTFLLQGGVLK